MRLVLHRKYRAGITLGRLFLGKQQLCFTREPPKACFGTETNCLEEGVYELEPIHSEEKGWEIGIGEKGKIRSLGLCLPAGKAGTHRPKDEIKERDEKLESCSIYPVTSYRADGTPLFTKLALLKLIERLEREWERGEVVELQIVSEGIPYQLESCLQQSYS
ncbi:hypothetical protein FHS59_003489 [Algoriphagus iocasae]|uniref:DUF5675 domain-containing protein n=1 Tax=Algoriphagus iocasae TaxID=1836499 RepID=A0A841MUS7_9BACT|nr:DUF5675 family protein [Algoriphagus iocasae]MBB6327846.1 hypothetical protein [Algoriphagus iocasae]